MALQFGAGLGDGFVQLRNALGQTANLIHDHPQLDQQQFIERNASTSLSRFSLDRASLGRFKPRAESRLFTLVFSALRCFTSVSRVWARLATRACCLGFIRTSGNKPLDRYSASSRASFQSVFFTDRLISRN